MESHTTLSGHSDSVYWVDFSPDGHRLVTTSRDRTAAVWDLTQAQVEHRFSHRASIVCGAFSREGELLATGSTDGRIEIWRVADGSHLGTLQQAAPECLLFSPLGELVVGGSDSILRCWDVASGQLLRSFEVSGDRCSSLAYSADDSLLAVSSSEGEVVYLQSESWTPQRNLPLIPPRLGTLYTHAMSPDGETCAASLHIRLGGPIGETGTPDRYEIALWSRTREETPVLERNLLGHAGWIGSLSFSPRGDLLASGSYDESVRLWDPYFRTLVAESREHKGAVYRVTFSPDGRSLASCSADGSVKLWLVADARVGSILPARPVPRIEEIVSTVAEGTRYGRNGLVVAAQDVLQSLLSLDSMKEIEEAGAELLLTHPEVESIDHAALEDFLDAFASGRPQSIPPGFLRGEQRLRERLMRAISQIGIVRQEQAYREQNWETFYHYLRVGHSVKQAFDHRIAVEINQLQLKLREAESSRASSAGQAPESPALPARSWLGRLRDVFRPRQGSRAGVATDAEAGMRQSVAAAGQRRAGRASLAGILDLAIAGALAFEEAEAQALALRASLPEIMDAAIQMESQKALAARGRLDPRSVAKAQEILFHLAEPHGNAQLLCAIGAALGMLTCLGGDNARGAYWLERALGWAREIGEPTLLSAVLGDLGNAYRNVGRLRDALRVYEEAVEIADQHGVENLLVNHLNNMAIVYSDLGDRDGQERSLRRALAWAQALEGSQKIPGLATNLGILHRDGGDPEGALDFYRQGLAAAEAEGDERSRAALLGNAGQAYHDLGRMEEATEHYRRALAIAEQVGSSSVQINALTGLGAIHVARGELSQAQRALERAVEISGSEQVPGVLISAIMHLAEFCELELGEPRRALGLYRRAVRIAEALRGEVDRPGEGVRIQGRLVRLYEALVRLSVEEGRVEEAFLFSESARAALLLESLRRRSGPVSQATPYSAQASAGRHLPLAEIRRHLRELGPQTVLVSYFLAKEVLYTFVLRADDEEIRCERAALATNRLADEIENFDREVRRFPELGDTGETWLGLGATVAEPMARHLREGDVIYLVPHGLLHNLPLHALRLRGRRLIELWPVVYLPAASALPFLTTDTLGRPASPVVVGAHFTAEAEAVADLLGANHELIGDSLDKPVVLAAIASSDMVHVSAFGFFSRREPERSGWLLRHPRELTNYLAYRERSPAVLSEHERVQLRVLEETARAAIISAADIEHLQLHIQLVSLSACESGLVHTGVGEDPVGLIRALLIAGAPAVVAALWLVEPASAQVLMTAFYQALSDPSVGWNRKPQALRAAMLRLMSERAHPYFWAPFVLIGGAARTPKEE